jgi:hypothetical protein
VPNAALKWLAFLFHIWNAPSSILGLRSVAPSMQISGYGLKIGHYRFLPQASETVIHSDSPIEVCIAYKLTLCIFLTEYHAMEVYWGNGFIAPRIFDLGTRWR